MIPSRTRQTVRPGGSIHQLPSAVTPHLTAANVDVWLSWKPERQVPFWPSFRRRRSRGPVQHVPCDGQEPAVCYGVSPPSANHTASCLFEQGPPMLGCSLTVAEKNEIHISSPPNITARHPYVPYAYDETEIWIDGNIYAPVSRFIPLHFHCAQREVDLWMLSALSHDLFASPAILFQPPIFNSAASFKGTSPYRRRSQRSRRTAGIKGRGKPKRKLPC
ncbi:hypothetical protein GBF38_011553 [Nibea albiflora]|uniref:Uncharacterized protein n=1 Tax=Nibea albiflora TaxID=240163 RepID=A0ACB7F3Y8_NIBAL|nr:hypothetical protein GBF38_011553 [Nibea albiflora]